MDKLYTPISLKNLTATPEIIQYDNYGLIYFKNDKLTIKDTNGDEYVISNISGTTVNLSADTSNNMILSDVTGSYCLSELTGGSSGALAWSGSTANGIATYVDDSTVCAQSNLTFDGSKLYLFGGGDCMQSSVFCGTACVRTGVSCATVSVKSPIISGGTCVTTAISCGTTRIQSPIACATTCVRTAISCATTCVNSPTVCGTTGLYSPYFTTTCGYVTGCFISNCLNITCYVKNSGLVQTELNKYTVTTTSSTNYIYTPVARPDSCVFYCSTTNYITSCLFIDLDNYQVTNTHACFHLHTCNGDSSSLRYIFRNSANTEFYCIPSLNGGSWNYDVDIYYNGSSFDVLHSICSCIV